MIPRWAGLGSSWEEIFGRGVILSLGLGRPRDLMMRLQATLCPQFT